jgi:hypothetical protein
VGGFQEMKSVQTMALEELIKKSQADAWEDKI